MGSTTRKDIAELSGYWLRPGELEAPLIVLACFAGLLWLFNLRRKSSKVRLPPGPRGLPVIGNIFQMGTIPHQQMGLLAREYGPLMFLKMGSKPYVVVTSPEMAREVLLTQDNKFSGRPQFISVEVLYKGTPGMVLLQPRDEHRLLRKLSHQELFSPKRLAKFQDVRRDVVRHSIRHTLADGASGKQSDIWPRLLDLNYNNLTRSVFSKNYYDQETMNEETAAEAAKFKAIIHESVMGKFDLLGDIFPALRWLDIGGQEAAMKRRSDELYAFFYNLVNEHRIKRNFSDSQDFVDVLLAEQDDSTSILSTELILGFFLDLYSAGFETTAKQTLWTLTELIRHPDQLRRVQVEIDNVVGEGRMVQESDLAQFKYLKAAVKESLRLHGAVPLGVPHLAMENTKIGGYDIPKNTGVIINTYAISRDEKVWENALEFNPDRFLNSDVDVRGKDCGVLPFGAGRRMCPGMNLGTLMIEYTLASYIHTMNFALPPGMAPMDVDVEETGHLILTKKNPLELIVTPRLPVEVYFQNGITLEVASSCS